MPDLHANFAYSTVATAPSPALSGVSLTVAAGDGAKFPAAPFNVEVWPANAVPLASNAEIARCTVKVGDVFTIVRTTTTESPASGNRAIVVGDQISCAVTKKTLLDIEYDTVVTDTSTGTLNNYNPGLSGHTLLLLGNASLATITGFAGGIAGQHVTVMSTAAGQIDFSHNDAGSTQKLSNAATSGKTSVAPSSGGVGQFYFDGTLWRLKQHLQGKEITATYNAGNFSASGGAWGVLAGSITTLCYTLEGRWVTVAWYLASTSSSVGTLLNILNGAYGGFTASATVLNGAFYNDNAGGNTAGAAQVTSGDTKIQLLKAGGANWSGVAGNTNAFGQLKFPVT